MNARRWSEIDNLYALGTVLVVFGHSHSSDWSSFSGTIFEAAISFIYTFHIKKLKVLNNRFFDLLLGMK